MDACARLPFPAVRQAGQSRLVGRHFEGARRRASWRPRFALAAQYDRKIIVERGIVGRELECAVLGNEAPMASLPCEILPSREFYDYDDKYLLDQAKTQLPADLPPAKTDELRRLAVECYRAVECEGMARVDFLLESATGQALHQRDQYHPRLHLDQHVPQDVGAQRDRLSRADRPADRAGAGPAQAEEGHAVYALTQRGQSCLERPHPCGR